MPIVDMKKISILGHQQEREQVVDLLHRMGTVELVDLPESDAWPQLAPWLEPDQASESVTFIESRLGEVRYCLDFFHRYFPVRKNFVQQLIGSKVEMAGDEFSSLQDKYEEIPIRYSACREAEECLTKLRNEENRCRNLLEELKPWEQFPVPLEKIRASSLVEMGLAVVPGAFYLALKEALAGRVPDFYLEEVFADKDQVYIFYIFPVFDFELVQPLFKEAAVSLVSFPETEGVAAEVVCALEKKLVDFGVQRKLILAGVEEMLAHRPQMMALYDYLDNERAKLESVAGMARTKCSFMMEGWAPAPALEELKRAVYTRTSTAVLVSRDPDKYEEVPILLHNRGPVGAYEVVTRLYSVPRRDEYDPTPFMAPFFFIFFGLCLADVGYGLSLSLLAFLLSRKVKLAGMGKQLVYLFFLGGVGSAIFGVLQGGVFGDLVVLSPLWFSPLEDPIKMLIICLALGLMHIYFGMGIQAYRSIKNGKVLDALFDQGSWFVTINGLVMFILPFPQLSAAAGWVAAIGASSLILTQGRRKKGLLLKMIGGVGSLYNITSILGNVLSYSRLLALGLSSAVIASVINVMGRLMAGSLPGFLIMVPILVVGHLFNLLINVLGAYVHSSRLHYVEFFGLFFEGGGKAFRPFGLKTKFVDVVGPGLLDVKAQNYSGFSLNS